MKRAETQSTWLWSEFLVVVTGAVLSTTNWISDQQKRFDLRESYDMHINFFYYYIAVLPPESLKQCLGDTCMR